MPIGLTTSLACLLLACLIGVVALMIKRGAARRKRFREENLKRRVRELTGEDYVKGHTTVADLEEQYGKKG